MLESRKLDVVSVGPTHIQPLPVPQSRKLNTWTPTATRSDVLRMVQRYVEKEFSIRSAAGKLVIDEGRLARKRGSDIDIDIDRATAPEILDAIRTAEIRRAVYAPISKRTDVLGRDGRPMRAVAPRRAVAAIVNVHPTRSSAGDGNDERNWRANVAAMLAKIPRAEEMALLGGARLRQHLQEIRNLLEQDRSELERLKRGSRHARNLRRLVEIRVSQKRAAETAKGAELKNLVRSAEYRDGVDHLLDVCTRSREIERYCFGER